MNPATKPHRLHKADYEVVARIIADLPFGRLSHKLLANTFADELGKLDSHFDRKAFLDLCQGARPNGV